jgi:hypothetical protein
LGRKSLPAKRLTADARARKVAELVAEHPGDRWILWCNTDYEADALKQYIPEATEVRGPDSRQKKVQAIQDFLSGKARWLIAKLSMFGWGLNLQTKIISAPPAATR